MEKNPNLHIATHPLIAHKMTLLRNQKTPTHEFRRLLREITFYLGYEATRNIKTSPEEIVTPMNVPFSGSKVAEKVAVIPILRAGLGMADGMLDLLPTAAVHHIGMYRSKLSHLPVQYYNRLPKNHPCDTAFIVDPCIATSNTLHAVVTILKKWGAKKVVIVSVVGARLGVERILQDHPDVEIFVGSVDESLSSTGMILPGIGDAGDRQFGTPFEEDPTVLHPVITEQDLFSNKKLKTDNNEEKN